MHIFLPRRIPAQRLMGGLNNTYYGVAPPSFLTPKEASCTCAVGEVSLTSGVIDGVVLSLCSGRAQLLSFTWSLKCRWNTKLHFTLLGKFQLLSQGSCLPPTSSPPGPLLRAQTQGSIMLMEEQFLSSLLPSPPQGAGGGKKTCAHHICHADPHPRLTASRRQHLGAMEGIWAGQVHFPKVTWSPGPIDQGRGRREPAVRQSGGCRVI